MSFFIWPQESPTVVSKSFPVRSFNQTVCPGEKCWGKCISSLPAPIKLIRALFFSAGAEQAIPAPKRCIIALVKGLREDLCQYAYKPSSWVRRSHRGWVWSSLPLQLAGKNVQQKGKTDFVTLTGWSTAGWDVVKWCGVQCADLQTELCIQSSIWEETHPTTLTTHHAPKQG